MKRAFFVAAFLLLCVARAGAQGFTPWEKVDTMECHDIFIVRQTNQMYLSRGRYQDHLYRSDDGAKTWIRVGDPFRGELNLMGSMYYSPYSNALIFGAWEAVNDDTDLAVSRDSGKTWQYPPFIPGSRCNNIVRTRSGKLFCLFRENSADSKRSLIASDDAGIHWYNVFSTPVTNPGTQFDLAVDSSGNLVFWAFPSWRSSDDGQNWTLFPILDSLPGWGQPLRVTITQRGSYLVSFDSPLYRSTDTGQTWDTIQKPCVGSNGDPKPVLLPNGVIYNYSDVSLDYSTDDGATWTSDTVGLGVSDGSEPLGTIVGMDYSNDGYIYVSTLSGLFRAKREIRNSVWTSNPVSHASLNYFAGEEAFLIHCAEDHNAQLIVSDVFGRAILPPFPLRLSGEGTVTVSVSSLPEGLYFARLTGEHSDCVTKFWISK